MKKSESVYHAPGVQTREMEPGDRVLESELNYLVWCPGCESYHPYRKGRWTFNGDYKRPTFTPSMLIAYGGDRRPGTPEHRCHTFVTDGKMQFLSDCTHSFAGKTIDMEPEE